MHVEVKRKHHLQSVQDCVKTVYFKTCLKCPPAAFAQARSFRQCSVLMEFCGRSSQIDCVIFFQLLDGILSTVEMYRGY